MTLFFKNQVFSQGRHNSSERSNFKSPQILPEDPSYRLQDPEQSTIRKWLRTGNMYWNYLIIWIQAGQYLDRAVSGQESHLITLNDLLLRCLSWAPIHP